MTGTILAKRYGDYREFAVGGALASTVRCAWLHSAPVDGVAARVAVVPDGCVDLLWTENGFMVAGPDRTAAFPPMPPGAAILGLRFKPGIAPSAALRSRCPHRQGRGLRRSAGGWFQRPP